LAESTGMTRIGESARRLPSHFCLCAMRCPNL
jgi:hypothetical protein